jgi:predicted DNA-binding antitoxin AbrB/MazE fold protein
MEIEATYQNGVLKPDTPLPLQENQRVKVTVSEIPRRPRRKFPTLGWTGDSETLHRFALDPEFLPEEAP